MDSEQLSGTFSSSDNKCPSNLFGIPKLWRRDIDIGQCISGLGEIGLVGLKFKIKTHPLGFGQEI